MVFLAGPRQVGKTTLSRQTVEGTYSYQYLNWDNIVHREIILSGINKIYQGFKPEVLSEKNTLPLIIFDELHKYKNWKTLLKGYFDEISDRCKIMVTGSAKLNVYRKGGDSMMGRYFLYHIHPLSVAEINGANIRTTELIPPYKIDDDSWDCLLKFGGFPEPFSMASETFYNRWSSLKQEQLFREDLRDLSKIHDIARIELLAELLTRQVSSIVKYTELAKKIQVTEPTIRQWITTLRNIYYCFQLQPWSRNVSRSLLKTPKIYCWDWSLLQDKGALYENLVASHLHKAAHYWTDQGFGEYKLYYLRDKDGHEVDFLVTKNKRPWLMVEVKSSTDGILDPNLLHFSKYLKAPHVLQVVADMPYIDKDCFSFDRPMIVPLKTFLSQLV